MKDYVQPIVTLIIISDADIITLSGGGGTPSQNVGKDNPIFDSGWNF